VGVCRFCGRGVCEDHAKTQPFIMELFKTTGVTRSLVVEDALFCGACTPRPEPVELPELDV
jgi:hypothetical protein